MGAHSIPCAVWVDNSDIAQPVVRGDITARRPSNFIRGLCRHLEVRQIESEEEAHSIPCAVWVDNSDIAQSDIGLPSYIVLVCHCRLYLCISPNTSIGAHGEMY